MRLRIASFVFTAFLVALGASARAADTSPGGSGSATSSGAQSAPSASADACKGASEGAQCKFQGRSGREISGSCASRNGTPACMPAHHPMHRGGQHSATPMQ